MNIDEARRIVADCDTISPGRALEAVATMLRFEGISQPRYLPIAESIESISRAIDTAAKQTTGDAPCPTAK